MSICRSCGARIIWLETAAGHKIPVDEDPAPDGNIIVIGRMAHVMSKTEAANDIYDRDNAPRYKSHFVTCPQAKEWRGRGQSPA